MIRMVTGVMVLMGPLREVPLERFIALTHHINHSNFGGKIPTINTIPTAPKAQAPYINKTLSCFLDEFKFLIHLMLSLITKLISSLTEKKNVQF